MPTAASVDKLAELAGISPDGVKWQLGKLKRDGYIERIGSNRSGTWKVLIKKIKLEAYYSIFDLTKLNRLSSIQNSFRLTNLAKFRLKLE